MTDLLMNRLTNHHPGTFWKHQSSSELMRRWPISIQNLFAFSSANLNLYGKKEITVNGPCGGSDKILINSANQVIHL